MAGGGLATTADTAIVTEGTDAPGTLRVLAREGQSLPGVDASFITRDLSTTTNTGVAVSARGHTAFYALTAPSTVPDPSVWTGLWAADAAGDTRLIAHRSVPFELAPGDTRFVHSVGHRLSQPPSATSLFLDAQSRLLVPLSFRDDANATAITSAALVIVTLDPAPACPADYNGMNGADLLDIFAFLQDWFNGVARADFNQMNGVDLLDIFGFLQAWFNGC